MREMIASQHRDGKTVRQIADTLGVWPSTVYYHLHVLGVRPIRPPRPLDGVDIERLVDEHGMPGVARMFGVSRQAVHQALRRIRQAAG
jgi:DNA-directed RNA polymerase specialized sigma24 family protein